MEQPEVSGSSFVRLRESCVVWNAVEQWKRPKFPCAGACNQKNWVKMSLWCAGSLVLYNALSINHWTIVITSNLEWNREHFICLRPKYSKKNWSVFSVGRLRLFQGEKNPKTDQGTVRRRCLVHSKVQIRWCIGWVLRKPNLTFSNVAWRFR